MPDALLYLGVMRNKFFLAYGFLIWLPSKVATRILVVLLFLANASTTVDVVDTYADIDPPTRQVMAPIDTESGLAEVKNNEIPDPQPPTTASDWSPMVQVTPFRTE